MPQNKQIKEVGSPESARPSIVTALGGDHTAEPAAPAAHTRIDDEIQNPLQKVNKSIPDHVSISSPESSEYFVKSLALYTMHRPGFVDMF